MARPDVNEIMTIESSLLDLWRDSHADWTIADEFYGGSFQVWTKPEHQTSRSAYHPSKARDLVDHAVDTQMAYKPKVTRRPVGRGERHKADSDAIENVMEALMLDCFLKEMEHPAKRGGKNVMLYGYTNFEAPLMNLESEPEEPVKKESETRKDFEERQALYEAKKAGWNPFRIRTYNPARILLDPTERIPTIGIKRGYWFAKDLIKIAKKKGSAWQPQRNNPFDRYKLADYWDEDSRIVVVSAVGEGTRRTTASQTEHYAQGDVFLEEDNEIGIVPFTHAYSGFGYEPTDMMAFNPRYLAQGLLAGKIEALRLDAQARSGLHNALMNAVYYKMRTQDPPEVARKKLQGEVLPDTNKDDYSLLEMPNLPAWVSERIAQLDHEIEFGTLSSALAGFRQEGVTTVGQQAILSSAAERKFINPNMQMDFMFSQICSNILRMIEMTGKTLTIRGETIKPDMIHHNYTIEVSFEVINPVLHLQEKQFAISEVMAGLRSIESYWEIARLSDTTEERRRLYRDMLMKDPRVQELVVNAVAKGVGMKEMLDQIEEDLRQSAERQKTFGGSGLLGPDGNPLSTTATASPFGMPSANPAEPGGMREAAIAGRQLRQPVGFDVGTAAAAKPGRKIPFDMNGG